MPHPPKHREPETKGPRVKMERKLVRLTASQVNFMTQIALNEGHGNVSKVLRDMITEGIRRKAADLVTPPEAPRS